MGKNFLVSIGKTTAYTKDGEFLFEFDGSMDFDTQSISIVETENDDYKALNLSTLFETSGTFQMGKYGIDMLLKGWSYEKCRLYYKMKSTKNNRSKKRLFKRLVEID